MDRNDRFQVAVHCDTLSASLSARRAWIEILKIGLMLALSLGRSPQGERG